jgi:hypothetical protein
MSKLYSHIVSRVLFVALFAAMAAFDLVQGISLHLVGRSMSGLAFVLLGALSFLQPVVISVPLSNLLATSQAAAIGPRGLRTALSFIALGCLFVGAFVRYVLKA